MAFNKHKIISALKTIAYVVVWLALVCGLVFGVYQTHVLENKTACTAINVHIEPDYPTRFVNREMVIKTIRKDGNEQKLIGLNVNSINIPWLEQKLNLNPMIKKAQVYSDLNGRININIIQRRPVLRIINSFDEHFYFDEEGLKMPVSVDYTAHVPVATGFIFERNTGKDSASSMACKDLFKIATYVDKDTFWNAQIEQIFVTVEGEYTLVPRLGNQLIYFGSAEQMEDKFNRLQLFYEVAMPKVGWQMYSSINVKYLNQIVCKKNNNPL